MFKLFQRQSWVSVVGGRVGGGGGGGVGVLANQKQWTGGTVRRGQEDFVELVASVFNGGGLSFEMGTCTGVGGWRFVGALALCYVGGCRRLTHSCCCALVVVLWLWCFGCCALVVVIWLW